MKAIQALTDLLVVAFCLFYIGVSVAAGKWIIALLVAIFGVLAWNHLQNMQQDK